MTQKPTDETTGSDALEGVKVIVFDLFDTLVDLRFDKLPRLEVNGERWPSTLRWLHEEHIAHHGIAFEDFLVAVRTSDRELHAETYEKGLELSTRRRFAAVAERLGIRDEAVGEALRSRHMQAIRDHTELPAHHPELLERLARRYRLALCSNFSDTDTAVRVIEEFGLAEHLSAVVVSETTRVRKPGREIFQTVLDELGADPAHTLHVGDSLRADIGGATPLGMRTAWITRRIEDPAKQRQEWEGPEPTVEIEDLAELEALR